MASSITHDLVENAGLVPFSFDVSGIGSVQVEMGWSLPDLLGTIGNDGDCDPPTPRSRPSADPDDEHVDSVEQATTAIGPVYDDVSEYGYDSDQLLHIAVTSTEDANRSNEVQPTTNAADQSTKKLDVCSTLGSFEFVTSGDGLEDGEIEEIETGGYSAPDEMQTTAIEDKPNYCRYKPKKL